MRKLLSHHNRLHETLFLFILCCICFSLSLFRIMYTDSKLFIFLNWNLFLAFLPWALTSLAMIRPKFRKNKISIAVIVGSWLLFFPNAPYILTDLFHLRKGSAMPMWYDLVLILTFAWTGLLFGFFSLWDIEKIFRKKVNIKLVRFMSVCLLFLGSFGIYLGRYLRWNSWDIITEPLNLLYDIGHRVVNPLEYPRTWGVTILMGIFLNILYWSFRLIQRRDRAVMVKPQSVIQRKINP